MDVLVSEHLDAVALQRLAQKHTVVSEPELWKNPSRLKESIATARALVIRNQTKVTAELLACAPRLIAIGRLGVGLDNIDVEAATNRGVVVIAPLNANAVSVAELTLGLILGLARKIVFADRSTRAGGWDRKACAGLELDGKALAICGLGRIGRLVGSRARAFGMKLVVFDPFLKPDSASIVELGARLCKTLEETLSDADFVTVHSPLTPETRHLFNERSFGATKKGSFFINTSRGGVMDENALLKNLRSGHLAGAALDVRETEPPASRTEFETMDNVILTPHIGSFTVEAQTRTFEAVCDDLDRIFRGEPAVNYVNLAKPAK